jgi:hypothetical protein
MLKSISKYLRMAVRMALPCSIHGTTIAGQAKYSEILAATKAGLVSTRLPMGRNDPAVR